MMRRVLWLLIAATAAQGSPALAQDGNPTSPPATAAEPADVVVVDREPEDAVPATPPGDNSRNDEGVTGVAAGEGEDGSAGQDNLPALSDLRMPDSPAANILGIATSEIQRPSSPRDFAISVVNGFSDGQGFTIPVAFAVEIAPFWISDAARDLTLREYVNSPAAWLYQNLTFSIAAGTRASEDAMTMTTTVDPAIAVGVRTTLYEQRTNPAIDSVCSAFVADFNNRRTLRAAELIASGVPLEEARQQADRDVTGDWEATCAEWIALTTAGRRHGFYADIAFASSLDFTDVQFNDAALESLSTWLTLGGSFDRTWSITAMARYRAEGFRLSPQRNVFDVGAQILAAWDRFGVSLEGVYRGVFLSLDAADRAMGLRDSDHTLRVTLALEARVSESLWINVSGGHQFDRDDQDGDAGGSFFALANLRAEFGDRRTLARPE